MAKSLGLPQTKGQFQLKGLVTGMQREKAFQAKQTRSQRNMNILNFGVETAPDSSVFVTIQGMERDKVYFSKRSQVKGQKGEVKSVDWNSRHDNQGEGFQLIGIGVGLDKDETGKNIINTFTEYDAAEEVYQKLEDEQPVFIRGEIEFSHFKNNKDEVVRNRRFAIKNIYNSKAVDFEADDFTETSDFKQRIIFMNIEKADDKNDPHFILEAKLITYNTVEQAEFVIRNVSLANQFKRTLKPYTAIDVWGKIFNKVDTEEEVEATASVWGEEDSFKTINKSYIRELVIVGADPETIDTETYSEEIIQEALDKMNAQGQVEKPKESKPANDSWGEKNIDIKDDNLPW